MLLDTNKEKQVHKADAYRDASKRLKEGEVAERENVVRTSASIYNSVQEICKRPTQIQASLRSSISDCEYLLEPQINIAKVWRAYCKDSAPCKKACANKSCETRDHRRNATPKNASKKPRCFVNCSGRLRKERGLERKGER